MSFNKLTLATAITAASLNLYAEDKPTEQLIVSGTRSEQSSVQIPASIQVLTAEDIKFSGASNLIQVLNAQAGLQINDLIGNGGRAASISMRGFGENNVNNVLVLVDGRKLNNPTLAAPNLSSISMKDVERVEIIQGSAGTLFGDQATGGVINVITKHPTEMNAHIESSRGSDDLEAYRGSISQGFENGVSYRVSAEKKLSDNYRDNNEANYSNVLANVAYEQQAFRVFAEALAVKDDLNLPGSLNRASINNDREQTFSPSDFVNQDTRSYRIGGNLNITDNWRIETEYTDRDTESKGFTFSSSVDRDVRVKSLSPRLLGEIDSDNGTLLLTAGIDLQESTYEDSGRFIDSTQDISDIYAQVVIPLGENLTTTIGARYSELDERNKNTSIKNDDNISVYSIGGVYKPNQQTRIFLRRDESFRWANIDENGFTALAAGEILKPQESTSWEAGIEHQFSSFYISALIYDMNIDKEIYYDPTVGLFGANSNLEESDRQGFVFDSHWQLTETFTIKLNYSYVDAEVSSGLLKGNTVPFVADSTANLSVSYQLNDNWSFYADAQHTGNRYKANDDRNIGGKLASYTIYNANVRWDHQKVFINARASNLTGKEYEGFTSLFDFAYPAAKESFELTVGYNF